MQKKTQVSRLVSYLKRHKRGITTLEAAINLGICSLHRRIKDAEEQGFLIYGFRVGNERHMRYYLSK